MIKTKCNCCNKVVMKDNNQYRKFKHHYCSRSCAAKMNNKKHKKEMPRCLFCSNYCTHRNNKYCSHKCIIANKDNKMYKKWKEGTLSCYNYTSGNLNKWIRTFIINKYNNKCAKCGWNKVNVTTNKSPLEVHHIDGDYKNNNENNLICLCPNCHSLTENYKNNNGGNGRVNRTRKKTTGFKNFCIDCHTGCSISAIRCRKCFKKTIISKKPTRKQLISDINKMNNNISAVGRKYGVSDNSVRKWIKTYNI